MDIIVTIEKINDVQEFASKKGDGKVYKKFSFVGKTNEQFPQTICFTCTKEDLWNKFNLNVGYECQVYFNVQSREYQGRWYTEAIVWKVVNVKGFPQQNNPQPQPQTANTETTPTTPTNTDEQLPF